MKINNYKGLLHNNNDFVFFSHTEANDFNACSTLIIAIVKHTVNLKMIYLNKIE